MSVYGTKGLKGATLQLRHVGYPYDLMRKMLQSRKYLTGIERKCNFHLDFPTALLLMPNNVC